MIYHAHRNRNLDWVYHQSTGNLYLADNEDARSFVATGYSGAPDHVNRTESEGLIAKGPIPRGVWRMDAPANHVRLGPVAIGLEAADPKTALKRSGFFVHGDNFRVDGSASTGCIVLDRATRDLMAQLYWSWGCRSILVI